MLSIDLKHKEENRLSLFLVEKTVVFCVFYKHRGVTFCQHSCMQVCVQATTDVSQTKNSGTV